MVEIKATITFEIQGRQMYNEQDCSETITKTVKHKGKKKTTKEVTKYDSSKVTVTNVRVGKENMSYYTRKCIPARQRLNISPIAFDNMVNPKNNPKDIKQGAWKSMSIEDRFKVSATKLAESMDGKLINYQIYED